MYLLDTDVFIQAKNLHYGLDFCPAFWSWLEREHGAGRVASIEKVLDELKAGADELADWARARPEFFLKPDSQIVSSLKATSDWATSAGYGPAAVNTFLQSAITFWSRRRTPSDSRSSPTRGQLPRQRRSRFRTHAIPALQPPARRPLHRR